MLLNPLPLARFLSAELPSFSPAEIEALSHLILTTIESKRRPTEPDYSGMIKRACNNHRQFLFQTKQTNHIPFTRQELKNLLSSYFDVAFPSIEEKEELMNLIKLIFSPPSAANEKEIINILSKYKEDIEVAACFGEAGYDPAPLWEYMETLKASIQNKQEIINQLQQDKEI